MSLSERAQVLNRLQGQTVRIPDLFGLFKGWPREVNPHQQEVSEVVKRVLETHSVSPAIVAKLTKGNLELLLSSWYPYADAETLSELAYFVCWMFLVDDEIDQVSAPGLDNEELFGRLYDEVMSFVGGSLEIDGKTLPSERSRVEAVESFRGIGQKLVHRYTPEQRGRFWRDLNLTMNAYRTEQQFRLKQQVPSYEAYWTYREGSSCIPQVVAMLEYANRMSIDEEVMNSPEITDLWRETCYTHWITNDIVSAKKEIAGGFIENLVVLASGPDWNAQDGLNHCVEMLKSAIARFDDAAAKLTAKYVDNDQPSHIQNRSNSGFALQNGFGESSNTAQNVALFIHNCRCMCVGNLHWSMASGRYGLSQLKRDKTGGVSWKIGDPEEALMTLRESGKVILEQPEQIRVGA